MADVPLDPEMTVMVNAAKACVFPDGTQPSDGSWLRIARAMVLALDAYRAEHPNDAHLEAMYDVEVGRQAGYAEGFRDGWSEGREQEAVWAEGVRAIAEAESNSILVGTDPDEVWLSDLANRPPIVVEPRTDTEWADDVRAKIRAGARAGVHFDALTNHQAWEAGRNAASAVRVQVGWYDGKGEFAHIDFDGVQFGWLPVFIEGDNQ